MSKIFGSKELCACLIRLGFKAKPQNASSHQKYSCPGGLKVPQGMRPFIIVILGKSKYDPHTCSSYMSQIKRLGIKIEKIVECLYK